MRIRLYLVVGLLIFTFLFGPCALAQPFKMVKDIHGTTSYNTTWSTFDQFTEAKGILFYAANTTSYGAELWRTDGTEAGTWMVKDIYPGSSGSDIFSLINANDTLYFAATDPIHGNELWKSDGTS